MTLDDLTKATNGKILAQHQTSFKGIGTDTRKDLSQQIFFALRGDQFDAHKFLPQAIQQKAAALIIDQDVDPGNLPNTTIVKVKDTLQALQDFSHYWRQKQKAKIVAMTGSNGKTTTKLFLATLLEEQFKITWTGGSLNNHWGVPMTLLETTPQTQWTVVEMGMNHLGEIESLCKIAEPDVVAVTMVGRAHIEHLGSQEKIAQAKDEIYLSAKPNATRVYNIDNEWTSKMAAQHAQRFPQARKLTFSTQNPKADVYAHATETHKESLKIEGHLQNKSFATEVKIFGEQNVLNLACAMALALGCDEQPEKILHALPKCTTGWGRNQWITLPQGARALFDAYNANPDSMKALLDNVTQTMGSAKKFAVLGDMKELGPHADQFHFELGQKAAQTGFEAIWFVGEWGDSFERGLKAANFHKKLMKSNTCEEKLALSLASMLNPSDIVVIKASRGVGLEKVLQSWGVKLNK